MGIRPRDLASLKHLDDHDSGERRCLPFSVAKHCNVPHDTAEHAGSIVSRVEADLQGVLVRCIQAGPGFEGLNRRRNFRSERRSLLDPESARRASTCPQCQAAHEKGAIEVPVH